MKKIWLKLADHFDARPPRERFAIFIGLTGLLLALAYLYGFEPALARQQKASQSLADSTRQQALLAEQEVVLIGTASQDPDAAAIAQLQEILNNNTRLRTALASAPLASPEKMTAVLRDLIVAQKGLQLISLSSGTPGNVTPRASIASEMAGIYRHAIHISVRGRYADLLAYLQQIEALPWPVQAGSLQIKTDHYPDSIMTLTLYTHSLERAWLGF